MKVNGRPGSDGKRREKRIERGIKSMRRHEAFPSGTGTSANEKCQRLWGVGQERETPLIKQSMSLPLAEIYFPI